MEHDKFARICQESGVVPVRKIPGKYADIYIGEGYVNSSAEMDCPHYRTVWFTQRTKCDIAVPILSKFGAFSKEQRMALAQDQAEQWIRDNVETGRYA